MVTAEECRSKQKWIRWAVGVLFSTFLFLAGFTANNSSGVSSARSRLDSCEESRRALRADIREIRQETRSIKTILIRMERNGPKRSPSP
jgi:hypothetical protein